MDEAVRKKIVDGFLRGVFDVHEALLGLAFTYKAEASSEASDAGLGEALSTHTVSMEAKITGGGEIVILLAPSDVSKIVSLTKTGEAVETDSLDDEAMVTVKEIAEGTLGGGVDHLGGDLHIESYDVVVRESGGAADLMEFVGDGGVLSTFSFSADPHFNSSGYLIHSAAFEGRVPVTDDQNEALVSDDEMKDILSGFSPDQETASYAGSDGRVPENIDVVLGISLTATARLGKVEMSISDVLNIGPGSIIEVGKLVDEPVELLVNGRLIARGDVVVVDEKFGLRITEIISPQKRIESLG